MDKKLIGTPAGIAGAMVMMLTGEQKDTTRKVRINVIRITQFGNYAHQVKIFSQTMKLKHFEFRNQKSNYKLEISKDLLRFTFQQL